MSEIQKADPNARRAALAIVGGGALLGVAVITIAGERRPAFEEWIKQDIDVRLRIVMAALILLTAGPAFGLAGYLWRLGQQTLSAGRYPPPGFRVVRDTPVVIGQAAGTWGRILQVLGAAIGVAGALMALFLWRLTRLLSVGST